MRFGLKDVSELPSMEEFEKLVAESFQSELIPAEIVSPPQSDQSAADSQPALQPVADVPNQAAEQTEKAG
jgi:segregation and condensation protein B